MQNKMTLPRVIAGTSLLGNLYEAYSYEQKKEIVKAYIEATNGTPVFDSAGKYGAGLALETLGKCLRELAIKPGEVIISNKLAWMRTPLTTAEPTFEPGVWKDLQYDAVQKISYKGIIACFEQGNELLQTYVPQWVSVHDPDEYLAAAKDAEDEQKRYNDILEAYHALQYLKAKGQVKQIGIGAKTWTTIERIYNDVPLDWVMLANSLTIYHHPPELLSFVQRLYNDDVTVINSAVFHGGFLVGSSYFNYQLVTKEDTVHGKLYAWRERFYNICKEFEIRPAEACIYFGLHVPGVTSIALNSSSPHRTQQNIALANTNIPKAFWNRMKEEGLIDRNYYYL